MYTRHTTRNQQSSRSATEPVCELYNELSSLDLNYLAVSLGIPIVNILYCTVHEQVGGAATGQLITCGDTYCALRLLIDAARVLGY